LNILLDTHIWLWYLQGSDRLSKQLKEELEKPDNELWLSPITIWEVMVLAEKGKIELSTQPATWVKKYLRSLDFKEAQLTVEIAIKSRQISLPHQDPADRFIAATALEYKLTLATVDQHLCNLESVSTIN
jgi:PIN domain nuclease of toxin-antitoxin system